MTLMNNPEDISYVWQPDQAPQVSRKDTTRPKSLGHSRWYEKPMQKFFLDCSPAAYSKNQRVNSLPWRSCLGLLSLNLTIVAQANSHVDKCQISTLMFTYVPHICLHMSQCSHLFTYVPHLCSHMFTSRHMRAYVQDISKHMWTCEHMQTYVNICANVMTQTYVDICAHIVTAVNICERMCTYVHIYAHMWT